MCLLTTDGSGLVVTPDAQSSGARGLLGVVGEVGYGRTRTGEQRETKHQQKSADLNTEPSRPKYTVCHINIYSVAVEKSDHRAGHRTS